MYWSGSKWVVGNWTISDWTRDLCEDYKGFVLNPSQAKSCLNASLVYYPFANFTQDGVYNFTLCNTSIVYKNPENSYPEGPHPALYYLLF